MDELHQMSFVGRREKWSRIITSIGALYLESCLWGGIQPLVSEWDWAMSNVTRDGAEPQAVDGNDTEARANFTVAAIFLATGLVEVIMAPIAGAAADRFGFDVVIVFSLSCGVVQSVLFGCFETSPVVILIYRILQGASSASTQTIALARMRDMYSEGSMECNSFIALGMCKLAFSYFSALIVGELYHSMKNRVFFLFTPFCLLFIIGVLLTFRTVNFHSAQADQSEFKSPPVLRWRIFFDVQLILLALCFFIASLGQSALEPSVAIWMKSAYGVGPATAGLILGLCGLASIIANMTSAQIFPILKDRSWILLFGTLLMTGLPLILMNFSPDIISAGFTMGAFFISMCAARFAPLVMCSTIADSRYAQAYGQVFSVINTGWATSFLVGPLLAPFMFGSTCGVCIIGAACMASSSFAIFLRHLDSKQGPNILDCWTDYGPEYELMARNNDLQFTYDILETNLQPAGK